MIEIAISIDSTRGEIFINYARLLSSVGRTEESDIILKYLIHNHLLLKIGILKPE